MPASKSKKLKTSHPTSVNGFAVLPLILPPQPNVHLPEAVPPPKHYLYIKPHEPSHPTPDTERSLFLSNIPLDASQDNIRKLFAEQLGGSRVEKVEFDSSIPEEPLVKRWKDNTPGLIGSGAGAGALTKQGKKRKRDEEIVAEGVVEDEDSRLPQIWPGELRRSGSTVVVVFVDRASCKGAWKEVREKVKKGEEVRWEGGEEPVIGAARYTTHNTLRYPKKSALQSSINAYLSQFNRAESARNRVRKYARSMPDEDGFVTVTRGSGRTGPARLEEAQKKQAELEERRKSKGIKDDFYRFQTREKKKEAEGELRRKFELDRKRVEGMRARKGRIRPET